MKQKIRIITVNIILILFCFTFADLYLFSKEYFRLFQLENLRNISVNKPIKNFDFKEYFESLKFQYAELFNSSIMITNKYFRKIPTYPQNPTPSHKNPILLLGCSYTYGAGLLEKELFSTQLANKTNRIIYNLAMDGRSPRTSLYLLRENFAETKKDILKNNLTFEYVIYTYIQDHKRRLYVDLMPNSVPHYINKNNELKFVNYSSLRKTYIYKNFCELVFAYQNKNNIENVNNIFNLYMKEINNEIKSKFSYGNNNKAKFVIFVYEKDDSINWDLLKEEGIIVIKASDLGLDLDDKKYRLLDNHPNAKAWEVIVPALAKELNL